jgi:hypothetical protein
MRNNHDPNWRPIVDNGGAEIQKHWHISFLTVLALSGALWLGVILWFAMRWFAASRQAPQNASPLSPRSK